MPNASPRSWCEGDVATAPVPQRLTHEEASAGDPFLCWRGERLARTYGEAKNVDRRDRREELQPLAHPARAVVADVAGRAVIPTQDRLPHAAIDAVANADRALVENVAASRPGHRGASLGFAAQPSPAHQRLLHPMRALTCICRCAA